MINIPIWFFSILLVLSLVGIMFVIIIIIAIVIHNAEANLEYKKVVEHASRCLEKVEVKNEKE